MNNTEQQKRSHGEPPAKNTKRLKDLNAVSILNPTKRSSILPRLVPCYFRTRNNPEKYLVSLSTAGLLVSDQYKSINKDPSTCTNQNEIHSMSIEDISLQ
jgi:hypothetical protein